MNRSADNPNLWSSSIDEIALHLFARSRRGEMSAEDRAAMEAWLASDPRHRAAFTELADLWSGLEPLRSTPAMLAMRDAAKRHAVARRRRHIGWWAAACALLAFLPGVIWLANRSMHPAIVDEAVAVQHYSTRVGEIRSVALADGTLAILDTDSDIRAQIGAAGTRHVELVRGRAMFAVAKMPQRPFIVMAERNAVTALGTRFDVFRDGRNVEVNLLEGSVRVERGTSSLTAGEQRSVAIDLRAGDRLRLGENEWHISRSTTSDRDSWTRRQLVFEEAPITEVVAALNRYTERKIVVASSTLGARRISAVIRSDNPQTFLNSLEVMGIARVRTHDDGAEVLDP